jgi:YVTN family beta-propeller protein
MGLAGCPGGSSITRPSYLPRFAYVANYGDNTVSQYTVNAATGQLRHNGYVLAGASPVAVTVDPSNKFAYVANANSNDVSAYTINASSGVLTKVPCTVGPLVCNGSNFWAGGSPQSISVEPSGKFAYVTNFAASTVTAYSIDAATGALTHIGVDVPTGLNPVTLSVDPSGRFAYVANWGNNTVWAYTIDASTGALNKVGTVNTGTNPKSLTSILWASLSTWQIMVLLLSRLTRSTPAMVC